MENLRLIYEQIETAKDHLLRGGTLNSRLALILLDNIGELLMARVLEKEFAFEDFFYPPNRAPRLGKGKRRIYSADERKKARHEFEPKVRILAHDRRKISPEDSAILKVCHRLRNEAFHAGTVRRTILAHTTVLLFQTVVSLTLKLPLDSFTLPGPQPVEADAAFLTRFDVNDPMLLAMDDGREQIARALLEGITLDAREFATTLSLDLVRRIDENILSAFAYLDDGRSDDIDRSLQYGQFWQDEGIALVEAGVRQPQLDDAFERWQAQGRAKYTVWQINQWRRHAGFIARRERPSRAIDEWYALDEKIRPLEAGIGKAVADFDDQVNSQIHDRR